MVRGANGVIGVARVVHHHGPHLGFGNGVGEVVILSDFYRVGEIPGVKPIEERGDDGAKTSRDDVGDAHIFAAVHDLDSGDLEVLTEAEAGDGAAGFVVDVEYIVIFDFGMLAEEPVFDDFGPS